MGTRGAESGRKGLLEDMLKRLLAGYFIFLTAIDYVEDWLKILGNRTITQAFRHVIQG
jgi:hypothetical protein